MPAGIGGDRFDPRQAAQFGQRQFDLARGGLRRERQHEHVRQRVGLQVAEPAVPAALGQRLQRRVAGDPLDLGDAGAPASCACNCRISAGDADAPGTG
jgi:hypothetical protein